MISSSDISVIVPIYNRAHLVKTFLSCLLNQTALPGEIIIVDDGSSDSPEDYIDFSSGLIKFYRQENQGPAAARNYGISLATKKVLAFFDSDDYWLPNKLEEQVNTWNDGLVDGKHVGLVDCYCSLLDHGKVVGVRQESNFGRIFNKLLKRNTINSTSSVMCLTDAVRDIGGFPVDLKFGEDRYLWTCLSKDHDILTTPKHLVLKHHEEDNLTSRTDENYQYRKLLISKIIDKFNLSENDKKEMYAWGISEFIVVYANEKNSDGVKSAFKELLDYCGFKGLWVSKKTIPVYIFSCFGRLGLQSLQFLNSHIFKFYAHKKTV